VVVDPAVRPWVGRVVRLGYFAKGVIYSLIGVLALRVALGLGGGRLTDASGVLRTLLRQRFGLVILAIVGVGIIGYAAYYVFEALADLRRKGGGARGWLDRSLTIIKAVVYGAIGIEALSIVFFNPGPSGDAEDNARMVMRFPLGDVLLILIGIGVIVYGVTQLRMAWRGGVDEDIDVRRVRREASWLLPFGRFGIGARSVILLLIGGTMAVSGFRHRPSDADGYSEAMSTIASFNPWLLAAIGGGLLCFGVYQLCHARYAKIVIE
jgi:hypothetical protein